MQPARAPRTYLSETSLLRLAESRRNTDRHLALDLMGAHPSQVEPILRTLVADAIPSVRASARNRLSSLIAALDEISRIRLMMEWAASSSGGQRSAIAMCLADYGRMVGTASALEHLANDSSTEVRCAVALTTAQLMREDEQRYARVLGAMSEDRSAAVRHLARGGLQNHPPA